MLPSNTTPLSLGNTAEEAERMLRSWGDGGQQQDPLNQRDESSYVFNENKAASTEPV